MIRKGRRKNQIERGRQEPDGVTVGNMLILDLDGRGVGWGRVICCVRACVSHVCSTHCRASLLRLVDKNVLEGGLRSHYESKVSILTQRVPITCRSAIEIEEAAKREEAKKAKMEAQTRKMQEDADNLALVCSSGTWAY